MIFVFLPIIIISIIIICAVFYRRMTEYKQMPIDEASDFYESWLYKIPNKIFQFKVRNIKEKILNYIEKFLRKFKIITLKFENMISHLMEGMRKKRVDNREAALFEKSSEREMSDREFIKNLGGALIASADNKKNDKMVSNNNLVADKNVAIEENNGNEKKEVNEIPAMDNNLFFSKEKNILEEIKKDHRNANAYKKLGFLYLEHKDFDDARSSFKEAIRLGCRDKKAIEALEKIGADF